MEFISSLLLEVEPWIAVGILKFKGELQLEAMELPTVHITLHTAECVNM